MPKTNGQYKANFPLTQYLSVNGNGTGETNAIGNYSAAGLGETIFYIAPPTGLIYSIEELIIHIGGSGNFKASDFANITNGLTTGIGIFAKRGGVTILNVTGNGGIFSNTDFGHITTDFKFNTYAAGVESTITTSFRANVFGTDLRLNGDLSDTLEVVFNDDFSTLFDHHYIVHGFS